jgi:hypothetical protein
MAEIKGDYEIAKKKMPYQINGVVVRTHRGMDVELGVHNCDP